MQVEQSHLCVVCSKRKGTLFGKKACHRCAIRTGVEGTREKYGLPEPRNTAKRQAAFVRTWNRMRLEGATITEIAKRMRIPVQSVKNMAGLLRAQGVQLERSYVKEMRQTQPQEPVDRATLANNVNEHGGGKGGIAKCKCDLCLTRRRQYRREWTAANQAKVREYQRAYRAKKSSKPS